MLKTCGEVVGFGVPGLQAQTKFEGSGKSSILDLGWGLV